ncbi:MAG: hypothetical protein V4482_06820, partial [Pseudomonadota bacterium]
MLQKRYRISTANAFFPPPKTFFKIRRIWHVLMLIVLSSFSGTVNATSTGTNAVYDGGANDGSGAWTGITSGTPGSNQNNTFNSTGGFAALTITDGAFPYLNANSTNAINGNLVISGSSNGWFDNSANTITGSVTIDDGCLGKFFANGSGASANTITGGITVSGTADADFSNSGSGISTNTITGGITLNDTATANFSNTGGGASTNTIDALTLNASSTFSLGGSGSTTTIDTLNWNGGTVKFVCSNCSFGTTTINTLNLGSAPLTIDLYDSGEGGDLQLADLSGAQTLFTVTGEITGDPSNIQLINTSPFTEIIANGTSNGVTVSPDGKVTITFVPTATAASQSNAIEALNAAGDILQGLQTTVTNSENAFAPTRYQQMKINANIARSMKENCKDSHEALITALAQENSGSVVKIRGDWRVFATPFVTEIRNKGLGGYMAGFKEKYYGMLMGGSHYFKKSGINLLAMIGFGASKTQQDRSVGSYSNGKNVMLGLDVRKTFVDYLNVDWDFESNLSGIVVKNTQQRQGNPVTVRATTPLFQQGDLVML